MSGDWDGQREIEQLGVELNDANGTIRDLEQEVKGLRAKVNSISHMEHNETVNAAVLGLTQSKGQWSVPARDIAGRALEIAAIIHGKTIS